MKTNSIPSGATELLLAWRGGDERAADRLLPLIHDELSRLARRRMAGERNDHTLQPTALVNEAYLRLLDVKVDWQGRAHFLAVASTVMRRVLIDHARGRNSKKRSGGVQVTLSEAHSVEDAANLDVLDLDHGLTALSAQDEESSRVLELQYFGGLTSEEIASVTGLSRATVERRARFGKAWLQRRLS